MRSQPAYKIADEGAAPVAARQEDDVAVTLLNDYRLRSDPPSPSQYRELRRIAGLSPKSEDQAVGALSGSWAFRTAWTRDGALAAMGRVIGDGGWYFLIADIATHPNHQRQGLGAAVLDALLAEITERCPGEAYVTLTADPPGRRLYESRGFTDVAPDRTGMSLLT